MLRRNLNLHWKSRLASSANALVSVGLLVSLVYCSSSCLPGLHPGSPSTEVSSTLSGAVSQGVATGDVTSDSALVWLRTDGPAQGEVRFATVDNWERFESAGAQQQSSVKTEQFTSQKEQDFTLKVPLEGLSPTTRYRYDIRII